MHAYAGGANDEANTYHFLTGRRIGPHVPLAQALEEFDVLDMLYASTWICARLGPSGSQLNREQLYAV